MSWFGFIKPKITEPDILFGRYSDSSKTDTQIEFWHEALSKFKEQDYLHAYEAFFYYLNDEKENNVKFELKAHDGKEDELVFEIQQGSKVITGCADKNSIYAETDVAKFEQKDIIVMRKLLEFNYNLKYSHYSINEDNLIKLKFASSTVDGSPEKLYNALREVATHSDKQDDLLVNQFESLTNVNHEHILEIPDTEKEIKHRYMQMWINRAFNQISQLDSNQNDSLISYILLTTAFKIDYLCVPHGKLMNEIEEIQAVYHAPNGMSLTEKNAKISEILEEILRMDANVVYHELYRAKSTFGVVRPTAHQVVAKFIEDEAPRTSFIKNNQQYQLALYTQEFIIQYILFYFGIEHPTKQLLHLITQVINFDFFGELGFKPPFYEPVSEKLNKDVIEHYLNEIIDEAKDNYKNFSFDINSIVYDSIPMFNESMFKQIVALDYD